MFARIKKSGRYQYLHLVENNKISDKVCQRVISTVGRLDQLQAKGSVETLIRSLAGFSEKTLLINLSANGLLSSTRNSGRWSRSSST